MRPLLRVAIACNAVALLAAACAGSAPATTTTPQGPAPAATTGAAQSSSADAGAPSRFVTVPLRLVHAPDGGAPEPAIELHPDGTITAGADVIARLVHEGTTLPDGAPLVSVADDGAITIRGQRTALRMDARGDVSAVDGASAGASVTLDADGTPVERHPNGNVERARGRFDRLPDSARPTATLVYLTVIATRPAALPGAPAASTPATPPPSTPPPSTPPDPVVTLDDELHPTVRGLPAVSPDATTVAVADTAHDGLRGAPNLTLRLLDAQSGAQRQSLNVVTLAEGVRSLAGTAAALEPLRRASSPRLVRALAAVRGFRPLTAFAFGPAGDGTAPIEATSPRVRLTYTPATHELVLRDAAGAHQRRVTLQPARAAGPSRHAGCTENAPVVREAWVDESGDLVVLHEEYAGTDTCLAPEGRYRVFRVSMTANELAAPIR